MIEREALVRVELLPTLGTLAHVTLALRYFTL